MIDYDPKIKLLSFSSSAWKTIYKLSNFKKQIQFIFENLKFCDKCLRELNVHNAQSGQRTCCYCLKFKFEKLFWTRKKVLGFEFHTKKRTIQSKVFASMAKEYYEKYSLYQDY